MLKRLVCILLLLPIMVAGSAYAITCQSNEFKYIDNNSNEECIENKFQITTTNDTDHFVFSMSAKGTFYIDWGDGNVEMLNRSNTTTMTEYSHNYASANEYIIKFGGLATGYTTNLDSYTLPHRSCIFFGTPTTDDPDNIGINNTYDKLSGISGSLGAIFRTLGNTTATQPNFMYTFRGCSNLTSSIPENLFSGVSGSTVSNMFTRTFLGCSGLVNTNIDDPNNPGKKYAIPPNLFSGLSRVAAAGTFLGTFSNCTGLTGTIPGTLFNITSIRPLQSTFHTTFGGCSNLTGAIPDNLFANVSGAAAGYLFYSTFSNCKSLTGTNIDDPNNPGMKYAIPPNLFAGITGTSTTGVFANTFYNCSGLTGSIPGTLFGNVSCAPVAETFYSTFNGCSGLTGPIPGNLFSGISGKPASQMFYRTFYNCSGLTGTNIDDPDNPGMKYAIPPTLFSGISGAPATNMFLGVFHNCSELSGTIPKTLFSGISGKPTASMFQEIFRNDSKLVGSIPGDLFAGISGPPATSMFNSSFSGCLGLTGSIPENLFSGISGAPVRQMFYYTFLNCKGLTGQIPDNLFAGVTGKLAVGSFMGTFHGCTNLGKDTVGGTSIYYVPPKIFAGIDKTSISSDMMDNVFYGTGLLTACPSGTTQYITGFESYWSNKKSCTSCPVAYPDYNTDTQQCYAQVSYMDSDNDSLLKTEDVYYDAQNASGYNLPSYSPTKPDTILSDWTTGNGTVIDTNGTLTGNQVVYSKWGFHCDSDKWMYFNIENNETTRMCLCNDKRTEHTLVINHGGNTYHAMLVPESEHDYTINSNTQRHLKVQMGNTIYNAYDASVLFGD